MAFGNLELGSSSAISKCSDVLKITLFSGRGITNPQVRLYPLASANLKCSDSKRFRQVLKDFLENNPCENPIDWLSFLVLLLLHANC